MPPDLNSVPPSPRNTSASPMAQNTTSPSASRRLSQVMGPPPLPPQSPPFPISPVLSSSVPSSAPPGDNAGVGSGPGPLRHPRPLTAADLHLQLEKEQEAVVNRLTRELSLLRQQTASVASTTSSTSTEPIDPNTTHYLSGSAYPTSSRRHRSSSNLSTRSNTATAGTTLAGSSSVSGVAPSRDSTAPPSSRPSADIVRGSLSRENSVTSQPQRSETSSPSLPSSASFQQHNEHWPAHFQPTHHRPSATSQPSSTHYTPQIGSTAERHSRSTSGSSAVATARYEEATHHRAELEAVKRENELLRRRIRELERSLNASRRQSDASGGGMGRRRNPLRAESNVGLSSGTEQAKIGDGNQKDEI